MARGKKFNDDIKEKALAMLATNNNLAEVAKQLNIHENTLRSWRDNPKNDEFVELRAKKKREFVEKSWKIIEDAQKLLGRRIKRALVSEDDIDTLVKEITELDYEDLSKEQRQALYRKISAIKIDDVGRLATVLGTIYDKQALASNDSTVNIGGETLEQLIKKCEGKSEY